MDHVLENAAVDQESVAEAKRAIVELNDSELEQVAGGAYYCWWEPTYGHVQLVCVCAP